MPMRHLANSGGILHFPESYFDCVRPGIILYGVYPGENSLRDMKILPSLELKSKIAFVKEVPPGWTISYGATWKSD